MKVYIVYEDAEYCPAIVRVYDNAEQAKEYVKIRNQHRPYFDFDEYDIGDPDVEYDGPVWLARWVGDGERSGRHSNGHISPGVDFQEWVTGDKPPDAEVVKKAPPPHLLRGGCWADMQVRGTDKQRCLEVLEGMVEEYRSELAEIE